MRDSEEGDVHKSEKETRRMRGGEIREKKERRKGERVR